MNTQDTRRKSEAIGHNHTSELTRTQLDIQTTLLATLLLTIAFFCFPRNGVAQQSTASGSHGASASSPIATSLLIPAPLASPLDSRKLKTGDEVILKTIAVLSFQDGTAIPRGTKVVGHVTEAKARSRGDAQSSLAIAFDKLDLPDGKTILISGVIQAVGPDLRAASPDGGGVTYTDVQRLTYSPSVSASPRTVPMLNEQSAGVVGIKNLQLGADGTLSSDSKSVKLESGSQILLKVQVHAGSVARASEGEAPRT